MLFVRRVRPSRGTFALRARGPIVAVGQRIPRLVERRLEVLAAAVELVDRDELENVTLARHEPVDGLTLLRDARAQPRDRTVVTLVAVRRGLASPDERFVLR